MLEAQVADVKGVIVLDNEGNRIIAKYYNNNQHNMEGNQQQKQFERQLFLKSNKNNSSKLNLYECDILNIENYVAIFKCYVDMSIYVLGERNDNELALSQVLETIHDCFDRVFKHNIERKSLINNMTAVILVIDELIDGGIVMASDAQTVLSRINLKVGSHTAAKPTEEATDPAQAAGGGMFASVFASARSQLAKTLAL